jgi:hypothetical protein
MTTPHVIASSSGAHHAMSATSNGIVGSHFRVGKKIGEGSFGVVFEGTFVLFDLSTLARGAIFEMWGSQRFVRWLLCQNGMGCSCSPWRFLIVLHGQIRVAYGAVAVYMTRMHLLRQLRYFLRCWKIVASVLSCFLLRDSTQVHPSMLRGYDV